MNPAKKLAHEWAAGNPSALKRVEELLASVGATMESVQGRALELALSSVEHIDRLIMSAEARRNAALREINRHRDRKAFARALRDKVRDIEDAEVNGVETKIIAPADTTEKNAA